MKEKWKDITDYEGLYQVSNLGRIKRADQLIMKQRLGTGKKYLIIGLRKNKIQKTFLVHRIVAFHFIHNPENKPQVNHLKGNKLDNRATELEWTTALENNTHSLDVLGNRLKLKNRCRFIHISGENNPRARAVIKIDNDGNKEFFKTLKEAADKGFNHRVISRCCKGLGKTHKSFFWQYA